MFIHLETGTQCSDSGMNWQLLEDNILKCRGPWKNLTDNRDTFPFQCPTCNVVFKHISGFLQHIESPACEEGYNGGCMAVWGMLRQLRRNLGGDPVYLYGRWI